MAYNLLEVLKSQNTCIINGVPIVQDNGADRSAVVKTAKQSNNLSNI